jgi:hypothetical protein
VFVGKQKKGCPESTAQSFQDISELELQKKKESSFSFRLFLEEDSFLHSTRLYPLQGNNASLLDSTRTGA